MNKKKLHEKDLARVITYLTAPCEAYMDLPRKIRRKLLNRKTDYLVRNGKILNRKLMTKDCSMFEDLTVTVICPLLQPTPDKN